MTEFSVASCWWEKGDWPLRKGDEFSHKHAEDLRKRIFLIRNASAGDVDIVKQYGVQMPIDPGNAPEEPLFVPYDNNNWQAVWGSFGDFSPFKPGNVIVCFKDILGHVDLYINQFEMKPSDFISNPPVSVSMQLSSFWLLYPNPNKYHDLDFNAGRPEISADGRYRVITHPSGSGYCEGVFGEYTVVEKAHKWYPQQTDPIEQVSPLKISGQLKRRFDPKKWKLEVKDMHLTQKPWTHHYRTKTICTIGTCYPEHKCIRAKRINEYVFKNGDPYDALSAEDARLLELGQNHSDRALCESFQDQVIHVCEFQNIFFKEINDAYIKAWVHFNAKYTWVNNWTYSLGDIVWVSEYDPDYKFEMDSFYVCIENHTATPASPKMPGTAAGEDYWMTPAFQPNYFANHIPFAKLIDTEDLQGFGAASHKIDPAELWDCNGSAYELLLREIDPDVSHYDWYWDTAFPYVPWWLYTEHYEQYSGDPIHYPLPRGCWRRIWKYTFGRPFHPLTKQPFLMWPGEWGYPPGYWEGRGNNGAGEDDYRIMDHRFIVTQAAYDRSVAISDLKQFRVVDVENLYAIACAGKETARDNLLATHDETIMRHTSKEENGTLILLPNPQFTGYAQMMNDMRIVLGQLNMLLSGEYIGVENEKTTIIEHLADRYDTSLGAYTGGRALCSMEEHFFPGLAEALTDYNAEVIWEAASSKWKIDTSFYQRRHNTLIVTKELARTDGFYGGIEDLPIVNRNVAHSLYQLKYRGLQPSAYSWARIDSCQIGNDNRFVFPVLDSDPPTDPKTHRFAHIELDFIKKYWYWDGGGDKWVHCEEWKLTHYSDWPPEEFFANLDLAHMYSWNRGAYIWENPDAGNSSGYIVDYDKYPESVFERDTINFIEV